MGAGAMIDNAARGEESRNDQESAENMIVFSPDLARLSQLADSISDAGDNVDRHLRRMLETAAPVNVREELEKRRKTSDSTTKEDASLLLQRMEEIQRFDEATAEQFIASTRTDEKKDTLCVCISLLRTEELQVKAAKALRDLANAELVPFLAMQLQFAAAGVRGGAESQIVRTELRRALVAALEKTTDLDFSKYDASDEATTEILRACKQWLAKDHQPK
jgi:hypothetical protein